MSIDSQTTAPPSKPTRLLTRVEDHGGVLVLHKRAWDWFAVIFLFLWQVMWTIVSAVGLSAQLLVRLVDRRGLAGVGGKAAVRVECDTVPADHRSSRFGQRLYVEILDEHDQPCASGVRGEVTLTGGRNPFGPLLRYRTGDFAALMWLGGGPYLKISKAASLFSSDPCRMRRRLAASD